MTTLKTTALIVAATAAFSAPAFANSLADSLGVDEGRYTYNQLIQLQTAKEADDTIRYNAILSEPRTFDNISSTNPSVVIEHAADNNNTIQEQFLKDENAGKIDDLSASAVAEQNKFFRTQELNEEEMGS